MHQRTQPPTPSGDGAGISEQCRTGRHRACAGNLNFYPLAVAPTDPPVDTYRCDCGCGHEQTPFQLPPAVIRCGTCGRAGRDVQPRHIIGGSAFGDTVLLCDECTQLPPNPDQVPAGVDLVLLRTAERRRKAREACGE